MLYCRSSKSYKAQLMPLWCVIYRRESNFFTKQLFVRRKSYKWWMATQVSNFQQWACFTKAIHVEVWRKKFSMPQLSCSMYVWDSEERWWLDWFLGTVELIQEQTRRWPSEKDRLCLFVREETRKLLPMDDLYDYIPDNNALIILAFVQINLNVLCRKWDWI